MPPKGKLYDRYRGQRRSLKKLYNSPTTSKKAKVVEVEDHSNEDRIVEPLNSNEMQKICDELKQNRDWDTVIKQWKQTMSMRRDMISQSNDNDIQTVLQEWPLYKFSRAPELVTIFVFFLTYFFTFLKTNNTLNFNLTFNVFSSFYKQIAMDFDFLRPNNGFDFSKWEQFSKIAIKFFSERVKCSGLKSYLNEVKEIADLDIGKMTLFKHFV